MAAWSLCASLVPRYAFCTPEKASNARMADSRVGRSAKNRKIRRWVSGSVKIALLDGCFQEFLQGISGQWFVGEYNVLRYFVAGERGFTE